ncbi:hypothetical protein M4951_14315 [Blastopirellula sp. J2-11]|uniref:hypothetical protein n=1 Tax=Blastopirellula sp. J2-11 TaxID=2943192 RepID=UPI0021C960FE|nr:hypothetical protein [Blastopirellula sp. J2-11]UUO04565.1 hypothetical protein M4951_14315 [Blastopirellula sp. J2-11]
MIRLRLAFFVFALVGVNAFAGGSSVAEDAIALDLAFVDVKQLIHAQVVIDAGGRDYDAIWDAKFQAIVDYCDLNEDQTLSQSECRRLPSARALRESASSGFAPVIGEPPAWNDLDSNADGQATVQELATYYRDNGLGSIVCGIGVAPFSSELTSSLLERLDLDQNEQVTAAEWLQAEKILPALDQNDDELLGAGELVAGIFYPGASGNLLCGAPRAEDRSLPESLKKFPIVVLPRDSKDGVWMKRVGSLLSAGGESASVEKLSAWRLQPVDAQWRLSVSSAPDAAWKIQAADAASDDSDLMRWKSETGWITVRTEAGRLKEYGEGIRKNVIDRFDAANNDNDDQLTKEEWSAERGGFGASMVRLLDANEDEIVTRAELDAWLQLQREIGANQVMMTAIDCGPGLFELLDFDRNGALSRRELRNAWNRIESAGAAESGMIHPDRLPRQILLTFSLGQPTSPLGKLERSGPSWFLAMDRNGDGDVSRREFVGPSTAFDRMDRNRDDLVSPGEVPDQK